MPGEKKCLKGGLLCNNRDQTTAKTPRNSMKKGKLNRSTNPGRKGVIEGIWGDLGKGCGRYRNGKLHHWHGNGTVNYRS